MTNVSLDIALFAVKLALVFLVILTLAAYLVFAERKILAWVQDRKGPKGAGPFGLLQPLADLIKLLTKEDVVPAAADCWLFYLAPAIPAILIFFVIPFGAPLTLAGPGEHTDYRVVACVKVTISRAMLQPDLFFSREESNMESVNAKDRHGHTPLISASKEGLKDFVQDLLQRGADITSSSDKGKTALHYAAANGHTDIARMLITKGGEVDARDLEGHTPLMLAAIYGCNLTIQALLDSGANPVFKTSAGNTAILYAENNGHPLAVALLKKAERAKTEKT